eukprot:TRINITY_DN1095_c0_g1_i1.p1 TRINITY_DN1095_c0_g1~~TRINITY_DN1095_c0_g1_i1.p1  ORF type:complete len:482 (-),score=80.68 TRINITY_DN1095_c0_g1_i1:378-1622(-)
MAALTPLIPLQEKARESTKDEDKVKLSDSAILEIIQHNLYIGGNGLLTSYSVLSTPATRLWDVVLRGVSEESPVSLVADPDFKAIYATATNKIFKFEPLSGESVWQINISESSDPNSKELHSLQVTEDALITGSRGVVYCFNKETSKKIWQSKLEDADSWDIFTKTSLETEFMVTELGDGVLFVGVNGNLFALDQLTGKQIWSDPLRWKGFGPLSLLFDKSEKVLYVGLNGWVMAFTQRQNKIEKRNEIRLPGILLSPEPVALLLHKRQLFVGTKGMAFSLDKATLEAIWENPLKGTGFGSGQTLCFVSDCEHTHSPEPQRNHHLYDPHHQTNNVLLVGNNCYVVALNPLNGETKWLATLPDISVSALHSSVSSGLVTIFNHEVSLRLCFLFLYLFALVFSFLKEKQTHLFFCN